MSASRRKAYAEKVPVSPLKKVTIYGPVMNTKREQLRHVGTQVMPSKQTLFSSAQSLRGRRDVDLITPLNQGHLRSKSNEERPHSKTSVLGKQMKTRLNCNHIKPRCEACIVNKKRANKHKNRPMLSDTPRQSHVLPSTRSDPRGATHGRKFYDPDDGNKSSSILDANWKPGQDIYAGRPDEKSSNTQNAEVNMLGSRQLSEEGIRKRVQFADRIIDSEKEKLQNSNSNTADYYSEQIGHRNHTHRKNKAAEHFNSKNNTLNTEENADYNRNSQNMDRRIYEKKIYTSDKDDVYNSTSTTDPEPRDDDICKLCESLKHHCLKHSKSIPKYSSARDCQIHQRTRTRSVPVQSPSSTEDEQCLLCQRYGKKHYYIDDSDCCGLCEGPYKNPRKRSDYLLSSPANLATRLPHHHRLTRPPLHRRWSTPLFFSDGEEDSVLKKNIPYEPKTEVVKDLKKKLEDEYLHREYLKKKKNFHRRWRSWDAEDLEDLRNFRRHKCLEPWEYIPQHKCVHRYVQNDRLFLEPTLTDDDGSSLCSECGAPQPKDYTRDPHLYHITLGGLHNSYRNGKENANALHRDFLPNKNKCYKTSYPCAKSASRLPGDTSKHIFARLNRNVNNIFPLKSQYYLQPHLADNLRYRVGPHSKRHPSKSMALVDHLL